MSHFLHLFSPETFEAASEAGGEIAGFRASHRRAAQRVKAGDRFLCYLTKLSRWFGLLEVVEGPFEDSTPYFVDGKDPFVVRFRVKRIVWLDPDKALPIHLPELWESLSFTVGHKRNSPTWTGKLRSSLGKLEEADAAKLEGALLGQRREGKVHQLSRADRKKLVTHTVRRLDGSVTVTVPDDDSGIAQRRGKAALESTQIQAAIAQIGATMGMNIWLPNTDRSSVLKDWDAQSGALLDVLPLNYDVTTLRTIENIDVLWLKGRSMARAFEVEHSTAIYSGILRMADLLALQPNMDIKLHIVAPNARREKVFSEIRRPVFSLLDRAPLSESCTFISYDAIREIASLKHLGHFADTVLDEYAEIAE